MYLKHFEMVSDKFNFSWSEYRVQSKSLLENIYTGEGFHDVTLVTDDEQMIKSHKVVLGASSDYFQKILKVQTHPHPLIVLRGVKSELMKSILKFLYLGETSVNQNEIEDFVKTSKFLKISGLDSDSETPESVEGQEEVKETEEESYTDETEKRVKEVYDLLHHNEDSNASDSTEDDISNIQENIIEKQTEHIEISIEDDEDEEIPMNVEEQFEFKDAEEDEVIIDDNEDVLELESVHEESQELEIIYCDRCDYETNIAQEYQEHLSSEHANDLPCKDCDYQAKDKASLKEHMLRTHKGVRCNNCDEKFSDLTVMRKHILSSEACMANLF